jgi:hypothetical protein
VGKTAGLEFRCRERGTREPERRERHRSTCPSTEPFKSCHYCHYSAHQPTPGLAMLRLIQIERTTTRHHSTSKAVPLKTNPFESCTEHSGAAGAVFFGGLEFSIPISVHHAMACGRWMMFFEVAIGHSSLQPSSKQPCYAVTTYASFHAPIPDWGR